MPYPNYYPSGYQPMQMNPYQQQTYPQYQNQGYNQVQQSPAPQITPANGLTNSQPLTPPTIHAEIVQVDSRQAAADYPVAAGSSQMMMLRDDSAIFIKMAYANGQSQLIVYPREVEEKKKEANVLDNYVTLDMFNKKISELTEALSKPRFDKKQNQGKENRGEQQ